jgi:tetratricopeptide (TPR) repeat protein
MRHFLLAALILLLGSAPSASEPKPFYAGAAMLYSLDEVTIVYPSGDGEDVAVNRFSAERRASFLRHDHDIEAQVVADGDMDEEALGGNLLLLGWNNRVLARDDAPTYFRKIGGERLFLGSIRVEAGEDLLFSHISPFNNEKLLVFWSRIDLEAERSHILPFLGSDWAVYHDYFVAAQGMVAKGLDLPPQRNPNAEVSRRSKISSPPARQRSEHFTLHYATGMLKAGEAEAILEAREETLSKVIDLLGAPPEGFSIALFLYRTGERKEELTGVATNAHSIVGRLESHMTVRHARSDDPVQETLLLAAARMGTCYNTALCEGLAFALQDALGAEDMGTHAAAMMESGQIPSASHLLDEMELRTIDRRFLIPASALLASWLQEEDLLALAWQSKGEPLEALVRAMEIEPAGLDAAFKNFVAARGKDAGDELAFQKALSEVRFHYERGDSIGMVRALERALQIRPDDPETLYQLCVALKDVGEEERSENMLRQLIGLELDPSTSHFPTYGHYQLGKLYAGQEKKRKARAQFERMLELPDLKGAHQRAREALEGL